MNRSRSALIIAVAAILALVVVLFTTEEILVVTTVLVLGGVGLGLARTRAQEGGDWKLESPLTWLLPTPRLVPSVTRHTSDPAGGLPCRPVRDWGQVGP